jgi:hypothetical protein
MRFDDGIAEWTPGEFADRGWYAKKIAAVMKRERDAGRMRKWRRSRRSAEKRHRFKSSSMPVVCQNMHGHEHWFPSPGRAAQVMARASGRRILGAHIHDVIVRGNRKFGYFWRYADHP